MSDISYAQRAAMRPICRRVRGYFAPVDRSDDTPSYFDASLNSQFQLDTPPAPWVDAGWIENFTRTASTLSEALTSGTLGLAQKQFRANFAAHVEFDFSNWGKLQMCLSSGSQQMNLLASLPFGTPRGSGGTPVTAVATLTGSTATEIQLGFGAVDAFAVGDIIAVDSDYGQQTGYVGTGIPGAYVNDPEDVEFDADYVRRITFNVARIGSKSQTSLQLSQPLLGGAPAVDASVQKVVGFVDREGGRFFQEWSALFVAESETGARIFYHYPRVQTAASTRETHSDLAGLDAWALHARLIALHTKDSNDNEQVLCYRSFVPAMNTAVY